MMDRGEESRFFRHLVGFTREEEEEESPHSWQGRDYRGKKVQHGIPAFSLPTHVCICMSLGKAFRVFSHLWFGETGMFGVSRV